jgi:hypothetical protein
MLDILGHWFAAVCSQAPWHTWAPGEIPLPCCQRCTGLYVGAGLAALLHLGLRPRLSGRFLQIHGAFLLLMVPFGFHWVAQGPALRSISGVLFGFGVVTFLWLPLAQLIDKSESRDPKSEGNLKPEIRSHRPPLPAGPVCTDSHTPVRFSDFGLPSDLGFRISDFNRSHPQRQANYFLILVATLALLPVAATLGGTLAAYSLSLLAFWGSLALAALVAGNVTLATLGTLRRLQRLTRPRLQP